MVHILLTILKITGIVLLALLVLLLLLLASILFAPVRYSGRIRKQEKGFEKMEIRGRVSWLLRAVSLSGAYENGQFCGSLEYPSAPSGRRSGKLPPEWTAAGRRK